MTVLLENRTISMILMVPDVESFSSSSPIIEKLDRSDLDKSSSISNPDQSSNIDPISSMPVYHGSIVRIEQHRDDENISDLIVRVPNFQHTSLPTIDTDIRQQTRIKRRAPICPILNHSNTIDMNNTHKFASLSHTPIANTNRLTTGLRSLSRVFTQNSKSKRSATSISKITFPSALPDVEVMAEKCEMPISSKKHMKHENFAATVPKLATPKILSIKRKLSKTKTKPTSSLSTVSSISNDTQTDLEKNRINSATVSTIVTTQYAEIKKDNSSKTTSFVGKFVESDDMNYSTNHTEEEQQQQENDSMRLTYEVEQHFAAISQLISDHPLSSTDADSLSTHRYSTISVIAPDTQPSMADKHTEDTSSTIQHPTTTGVSYDFDHKSSASIPPKLHRPFHVQTSILQPDISVIRMGTTNLTTGIDRHLPGEYLTNEQIDTIPTVEQKSEEDHYTEQDWSDITHRSDDRTFAECYEVTYQTDSSYQKQQKQSFHQSPRPAKINLDPSEYKHLISWLPHIAQCEDEHNNSIHQSDQSHSQFEQRNVNLEHNEQDISLNNIQRIKSRSIDDLSRTSNDQTSTYQLESVSTSSSSNMSSRHCTLQRSTSYDGLGVSISTDIETCHEHFIRQVEDLSPGDQAGLKENDRILCINGTPVIDEDYTVVLQLIKHGLQTDTLDFDVITNDVYEEFKSQINQLYP